MTCPYPARIYDKALMKTITSKDNPIYKGAVRLTRKKYRDETGLYLLEGVKPLEDALATGTRVERLFICGGKRAPEAQRLLLNAFKLLPEGRTVLLEEKLFAGLSDTGTSQGVVAVAAKKEYGEEEFFQAVSRGTGNVAVLDRLQDPGNIGTIIRTAEAAGYRGIVVIRGGGDVYGPKAVRAAAGSLFRMPVLLAADGRQAAELLKRMKKKIAVTCPENAQDYRQADLTDNIALVIGNEGSGVSGALKQASHIRVKIPMEGSIESLNAAVAAGILMYQSQITNIN